jgi:hypothetical protein
MHKPLGDSPLLRVWPAKTGIQAYAEAATPQELHAVSLGLEWPWEERSGRVWTFTFRPHFPDNLRKPVAPFIPGGCPPEAWNTHHLTDRTVTGEVRFELHSEPLDLGLLWLETIAEGGQILYCPQGELGPGRLIRPDIGLYHTGMGKADLQQFVRQVAQGGAETFEKVDIRDAGAISRAFGGVCFIPAHYKLDQFMCLFLKRFMVEVPGFPKLAHPIPGASVTVKGQKLL